MSACAGNATETCGGAGSLSLYQLKPVVSSSSSVSSTSSKSSSSSTPTTVSSQSLTSTSSLSIQSTSSTVSSSSTGSTSASPTPAVKPKVGAYSFRGCYTDSETARALTAVQVINYQTMTLETCAGICVGYTYMGVEYWGEVNFLILSKRVSFNASCSATAATPSTLHHLTPPSLIVTSFVRGILLSIAVLGTELNCTCNVELAFSSFG
jgi:hypothetical protein